MPEDIVPLSLSGAIHGWLSLILHCRFGSPKFEILRFFVISIFVKGCLVVTSIESGLTTTSFTFFGTIFTTNGISVAVSFSGTVPANKTKVALLLPSGSLAFNTKVIVTSVEVPDWTVPDLGDNPMIQP